MAKKPISNSKAPAPKAPAKAAAPARPATPVTSPVRATPVPKPQAAAPKVITHEMIAKRAYEISQSPQCGSEYDNWIRAEREVKGLS